ncbi:MAG: PEP-CTERM sorting domain-containing protein [bacterium]|nr:PEP-CTERM sorting domain-containing protein [bacterium]
MRKLLLFIMTIVLIASPAYALTVLDFESVPNTYRYGTGGGNTNLGNNYPGHPEVTFGPDAMIMVSGQSEYNNTDYPPYSGNTILFSKTNSLIRIDFTDPMAYVSLWFTTASDLYLEAYNSSDILLTKSVFSGSNLGTNNKLYVDRPTAEIAYVKIHDSGNHYTIDNLGYSETPVPVPPTVLLLSFGLLGMVGLKKKIA